ncbi:MAG: winged helix-turn-helix domain-containing protein [Candidatus Nanohaloarchaea archaeon]
MNLDFKTVKALSSPTRIEILAHALKNEATPTNTADRVGKSKSTISSHMDTLVESGLLERDEEEGRKRVVYSPTRKAEAIVNGREKKVKFSIASSLVTGAAGVGLLYPVAGEAFSNDSASSRAGTMMMESTETATETGLELSLTDPFLFLSAGFMVIAVSALGYGLILRKLGK